MARNKNRRPQARTKEEPIELSRSRVRALAAIAVVWALLSPSLGTAILPADTISDLWHDWRQSDTEAAVEDYIEEMRDAAVWAQAPKVYETSVDYFEENYDELDPQREHEFPAIGTQPPVLLGFLATESAGWTGRTVLVSADVVSPPRLIAPVSETIGSYSLSLGDRYVRDTEVICRLPYEKTLPFSTKDRVTFVGLVLADGLAERERGSGMKRVIYMACASMVHSTNISVIPGSSDGKKRRPTIEVNE